MNTYHQSSSSSKGYYMVLGAILFAASVDLLIKHVSADIDTWQLVFMRWSIAVIFLLPWAILSKQGSLKPNNKAIYIYRAILNCIGSFTLFYSLATLPLSIVVTILFSGPVFMAPLAFILLNEKPRMKDIISAIVGFLGIIVVYNPADIVISTNSFAPIFSTLSFALQQILTKKYGAIESSVSLMFWLAIATSLLTVPMAIDSWVSLSPSSYGMFSLISLCGTLGSFLMIVGLRCVEVPKVAPLNYLTVPIAFIAGLLLFNEPPSFNTLLGCLIIIISVALPNIDKLFLNKKTNL